MAPSTPAVHVIGPRLESSEGAAWASVTSTSVRVTLPVFVTVNVYSTVCPTVATAPTLAVLTTEIEGLCCP